MNKLLTYLIIFSGLLLIPIMDVMAQENPDVVVVTTEGLWKHQASRYQ